MPDIPDVYVSSSVYVPLRHLIRSVFRRFYLLVALSTLFGAVTTLVVSRLPNTFVAGADLLLPSGARSSGAQDSADLPQDSENIRTEVLLVQSDQLVRKTVERLGLTRDPEFATPAPATTAVSTVGALRAVVATWLRGGIPLPTGPQADVERAGERVGQQLSVTRQGETHLIRVSFRSRSPTTAQQVVNTLLNEYLATQTATKVSMMQETQKLLVTPLQELKDSARRSQEDLERYRRANGLFDTQDVPLMSRQIAGLTEQLVLARAARADAESRAEETGSAQVNRQEVAVQRAREAALDRELTRLKAEYDRQMQAQIQAGALQREATIDQTLLNAMMERSKQLQLQMLTERPSATVVEWAQLPVFLAAPRRLLLLAIGYVASFAFALTVILLLPTAHRSGLAVTTVRSDRP